MTNKEGNQVLEMSAKFLNKLASDASFAKKFDKDPAAALQELFPKLAKAPKKDIAKLLDEHKKFIDASIATPEAKQLATLPGVHPSGNIIIIVIASSAAYLVARHVLCGMMTPTEPRPE